MIVLYLQIKDYVVKNVLVSLTEIFDALEDRDELLEPEVFILAADVVLQALLVLGVLLDQSDEGSGFEHGVGVVILRYNVGCALTTVHERDFTEMVALIQHSDSDFSATLVSDCHPT